MNKKPERSVEEIENLERITERGMHWVRLDRVREILTQTLQAERQRCEEMVEKCIKEVNYYRATPKVRRDFCEWCDEVLLPGDNCNCKTETVRQELLDLITSDLQNFLTQPNNSK